MYAFVKERLPDGGIFLLDEAQEVEGWERLAASLLAEGRVECFVTGSNASLLSSDLAGLLTGRYQEIPVHPLFLTEYRLFSKVKHTEKSDDILSRYLRFGGFPALHLLGSDDASAISYLGTLLDGILMRYVVQRHAIRDPEGLRRILAFAFDNIGSLTASRRISDYLKSQRRSISTDTVANYLAFLCDAFVLYKVRRYDIKGRQHLEYGSSSCRTSWTGRSNGETRQAPPRQSLTRRRAGAG
jgi:predicted AAA+ superfamily ATPase